MNIETFIFLFELLTLITIIIIFKASSHITVFFFLFFIITSSGSVHRHGCTRWWLCNELTRFTFRSGIHIQNQIENPIKHFFVLAFLLALSFNTFPHELQNALSYLFMPISFENLNQQTFFKSVQLIDLVKLLGVLFTNLLIFVQQIQIPIIN